MANLPDSDKLDFLLHILANSEEIKPDYGKVAERLGINTKHNTQRRLKGIVEADKKFTLVAGGGTFKVVDNGTAVSGAGGEKRTPKSAKKRGRMDVEELGWDGVMESPSKKRKAVTNEKEVEDESEGDNAW